eukprot:678068-Pleurochrysis_carterae.AAC.1
MFRPAVDVLGLRKLDAPIADVYVDVKAIRNWAFVFHVPTVRECCSEVGKGSDHRRGCIA